MLVRRVRKALHGARLDDRLTELDDRIADLDLHLSVQLAQIVHHTIEVQLARSQQRMLATLFDARRYERVALVHLAQSVEHLGQLRRAQGLNGHLEHAFCHVHNGTQHVRVRHRQRRITHRRALGDRRINAAQQHPVAGRHTRRMDGVSRLGNVHATHCLDGHVLLVLGRVRGSQHLDRLTTRHGATQHTPKRAKLGRIACRVHFGDLDQQRPLGVTALDRARQHTVGWRRRGGGLGGFGRTRQMLDAHIDQARGRSQERVQHELEERAHVHFERSRRQLDAQGRKCASQHVDVGTEHERVQLVQRLEHKLHKRPRRVRMRRAPRKGARCAVKVDVAP